MKKFIFQSLSLLLVALAGFYFTFKGTSNLPTFLPSSLSSSGALSQKQLKIDNTVINVEIASTQAQRSQGLTGRDSLASNSGMLFVFQDPKVYQFWMKGMKFPLDFIFIRNGKVVDIIRNVQNPAPNTTDDKLTVYQPIEPIDMMLEVNAGFIDKNNIKVGDPVFLVQ